MDGSYAWARLSITLLISTVGNVGMWAIIVIMPSIEQEFSIDRGTTSLPYALLMIGFAIGNILFGKLVDRKGIVFVLALSVVMISGGFLAATLSKSIVLFSLVHLILGVGASASFGPLIADVSHWFKKRRGLAVSIAASGNYLAGAFWPFVLAETLAISGWRSVYLFLAIISVIIILPLSFLLRKTVTSEGIVVSTEVDREAKRFTKVSSRSLLYLLSIAGLCCCVAMSMPQVHIVSYCVDLGLGTLAGGQMLSLMLVGGVISRLFSGVMADKFGGLVTLLVGSSLQCLGLFIYLPFNGLTSLYVVSLIFGLSQGGIIPSYAIIIREYMSPAEAGFRIGFVIMVTIFGMALGGWLSGWIFDIFGSYRIAFLNGIAWNLINIIIIFYILSRSGVVSLNKLKTSV